MGFGCAKQFLVTVTAMLSLFVSTASACACSHHEPGKKAIENTCHGPSHDVYATEQPDPLAKNFRSECNCLVITSPPASGAKSADKRTIIDEYFDGGPRMPIATVSRSDQAGEPPPPYEDHQSNYQHALLASLPSRAPPSL